jgi:hypothetical protein
MIEVLAILFHVLLGYGYSRTARKTNSKFGDEVGNAFVSLILWPLFLVFAAFNNDLYNDSN